MARHTRERRKRIAEGVRRALRERGVIVYLAGDMTGGTLAQVRGWRRDVIRVLEASGFVCLDPTRRDAKVAPAAKYDNSLLDEDERRFIYQSDLRDIMRASIVLANIRPGNISIGTFWELGYADRLGKAIVIVAQDEKHREHPFVGSGRARVFEALPEAIKYVIETYAKEETHAKIG